MCAARPESLLLHGSNTNVSDTTIQRFHVPEPKCLAQYQNYFTTVVTQNPRHESLKTDSFSLSLVIVLFWRDWGWVARDSEGMLMAMDH
jgi:hypothetical protein